MVRPKSLGAPSSLRPTMEEPVAHCFRGDGGNVRDAGLLAEELHGRSVPPNGMVRIAAEMPRLLAKALGKNFDVHMYKKMLAAVCSIFFEIS